MQLDHFHFEELDKIIAIVTACGGENVSVAGGAIRDSVLEKPIKDIDVFYQGELNEEALEKYFGKKKNKKKEWIKPPPSGTPLYLAQDVLNPLWEAFFDQEDKEEDYPEEEFSVSTYSGDQYKYEGKEIQLIRVDNVDETIAKFPCILSRMSYTEGHLIIPKEAIRDVCLGIVSFTDDCKESYKERIMGKYNDYA